MSKKALRGYAYKGMTISIGAPFSLPQIARCIPTERQPP